VLETLVEYTSKEALIEAFETAILEPALAKREELLNNKRRTVRRKRV
jgi:hypothetical protein